MSQHDMNIGNQTFPNFRADLNNALAALATNSLGPTAPSTPYAGMFWYESDTQKLWLRRSDNSDPWLEFATVDLTNNFISMTGGGTFRGTVLSPANPTFSFNTDTNTGMYSPADDTIGFSTAGVFRGAMGPTGLFYWGKLTDDTGVAGLQVRPGGQTQITQVSATALQLFRYTTDGAILSFSRNATTVGSVSVTATATTYNTSSDYRLKDESVAPEGFDPIAKLKALADLQKWYTWKSDPDNLELGWYAHELATIEPKAVIGEKDAVDSEGNPVYQGRSDTVLIPTLVAALDKAIKRIEELESRVQVLESASNAV